jgi:hypothetical protein
LDRVFAEIEEFRKTMPHIPLEELLSARHEGCGAGAWAHSSCAWILARY